MSMRTTVDDPQQVLVVGAGYVGLVTAIGLASLGHSVTLAETDPVRREQLQRGAIPIHEAGLQESFDTSRKSGRIDVAATPGSRAFDLVFLCVGTPIDDRGRGDLSQLRSAIGALGQQIQDGSTLVIRSTLPLGTTGAVIDELGLHPSRTLTNPEFLRQGTALADFLAPDRVVIGARPEALDGAAAKLGRFYEPLGAPVLIVGIEDAEVMKNAANAFLALKLSFANEVAALCEAYGADVDAVLDGIGRDPRIGDRYLRPSFGFGGSCLPKELQTLARAGMDRGLEMHVTAAAAEANVAHQDRFVARIERLLGGSVAGREVGLLGLAFKADTDDVRSSPALRVARRLMGSGAAVRGFDPAAGRNAIRALPGLRVVETPEELFDCVDVIAVTTEWPSFRDLPWSSLVPTMRTPIVVDGRRLLDGRMISALGARYERVGTPVEAFAPSVE